MLIKDYGCLISYRKCLVSKRWITRNRKWNYNYEPSRDGFREMRNEILSMIRKEYAVSEMAEGKENSNIG